MKETPDLEEVPDLDEVPDLKEILVIEEIPIIEEIDDAGEAAVCLNPILSLISTAFIDEYLVARRTEPSAARVYCTNPTKSARG